MNPIPEPPLDDLYREVVACLSNRENYPEPTSHVDRIETHISSVFLTDRFAYKLKKPVKFDFLDFSTAAKRRAACEEEVRINRRLAKDVYLGVTPIVRLVNGSLRIGGKGTVVDWVVTMQRLPAERSLDRLITNHQLRPDDIHSLSDRLLSFYLSSPPLAIKAESYRQEIERHVLANFAELSRPVHGLDQRRVRRVHATQLRVLRLFPDLFDARVCDGRIIDGHGDLRPEHIYFTPHPVVIDGIEFNAEMRRVDVLDELSFLAMECAALGAAEVGDRLVASYCEAASDHPPAALLRFYEAYRASVRAKVAVLRAQQLTGADQARALADAEAHLELTARFTAELGPPLLLMVWGFSGTGKSVLAGHLADQLGCELLQTDAVRRELFGESSSPANFNDARYFSANRDAVYNEVIRRADALLAEDVSVILDGTFLAARHRAQAAAFAQRDGVQFLSVRCECPNDVALDRIRQRLEEGGALSEFRPDLFIQQRQAFEPDYVESPHCVVDTTNCLPEMTRQIFQKLRAQTSFGNVAVN